jgi:hypothetical protein
MADFDILARLRRLEAENDKLKDRVAILERSQKKPLEYRDATDYKRLRAADRLPIWPMVDDRTDR